MNSIKAFGIVVRGYANAVDLLLSTDNPTVADVMDFYRKLDSIYDTQDRKVPVTTLVRIFEDQLYSYFGQVQAHITGSSQELPPKPSVVTPQIRTLLQLHKVEFGDTTRRKIVQTNCRARTDIPTNCEKSLNSGRKL